MYKKIGLEMFDGSNLVSGNSPLSLFQKILLTTDGSVTHLLSLYAGQEVKARKIEQSIGSVPASAAPPALGCAPDARLLHRTIMLVDAATSYVFAESFFIFDRLSPTTQRSLLETDAPIGLLWRQEKSEMYREIVDMRIEQNPIVAAHFNLPTDTQLLSRTYLLHQNGAPFGVITEKFPAESFQETRF